MKKVLILIIALIFHNSGYSCSMYKITINGKTIVGNNEDWLSPNSQFWFIPKGNEKYGVMHVGFINGFPQGGINEAGLMFDGFAMDYLEVKNGQGKQKLPLDKLITQTMQSFATVHEVKDYLVTLNLEELATGMLVYVDRSGDYLVVEGDEIIIGNESEQMFSNFYPSKEKAAEVNIPFYQNGLKFIENSEAENNFSYCSSVMKSLKQGVTQYSTVYDLDNLTVRLYFFHNMDEYYEISLLKGLEKGKHTVSIPKLFPKNKKGTDNHNLYNDNENPTRYLKGLFNDYYGNLSGKQLESSKQAFVQYVSIIGNEWLYDKKNAKGAIEIFKYGLELSPKNTELYNTLGNIYYEDKNYIESKQYFKKSLAINPDDTNVKQKLKEIEKID